MNENECNNENFFKSSKDFVFDVVDNSKKNDEFVVVFREHCQRNYYVRIIKYEIFIKIDEFQKNLNIFETTKHFSIDNNFYFF